MTPKEAHDLYKKGFKYTAIAEMHGLTKGQVAGMIYRYKRKQRPGKAVYKKPSGVKPHKVPLSDIQPRECLYPYGSVNYTFCGLPAVKGKTYCEEHCRVCYK
jgi:GcrA cell cycle regulator